MNFTACAPVCFNLCFGITLTPQQKDYCIPGKSFQHRFANIESLVETKYRKSTFFIVICTIKL
ncbi:MAG: hypothetical protein C4330_03785 [Chitinophagaceae bacterium]